MGISNYPRHGHPISPATLAPLLDIELPEEFQLIARNGFPKVSDLNATVWPYVDKETAKKLAALIVNRIAKLKFHPLLASIYFPSINKHLRVEDLDVTVRTFNVLQWALNYEVIKDLADLSELTLAQSLRNFKAFGVTSLIDLCAALESQERSDFTRAVIVPQPNAPLSRSEVITLLNDPIALQKERWRKRLLPVIAPDCQIEDFVLPARAVKLLNDLIEAKVIQDATGLQKFTVGEILEFENFGRLSLEAVLRGMTPFIVQDELNAREPDFDPGIRAALQKEATKLCVHPQSGKIKCNDLRLSRFISPLVSVANTHYSAESQVFPSAHLSLLATRLTQTTGDLESEKRVLLSIRDLRREIIRCNRLTLEAELEEISKCWVNGRNLEVVKFFFGWTGKAPTTLQTAGNEFSLTRERVRQITSKFASHAAKHRPFAPVLDKVLAAISRRVPCPVSEIERLLAQSGRARDTFAFESLETAAQILGRDNGNILESANKRTVSLRQESGLSTRLLNVARRLTSKYGLSTVEELLERLTVEELYLKRTTVVSVLDQSASIKWLDSAKHWFTDSNATRNHLLTVLGKLFAVTPYIHISEVRQTLSNDPRGLGFAPPKDVLLAFCRSACGCESDGEFVTAPNKFRPEDQLGKAEQILWNALNQGGPLFQRYDLERKCVGAGMNPTTFNLYLKRSPIVTRYGPGIYGLTGTVFSQAELQALNLSRPQRNFEHGWTDANQIWTLSTLTGGELTTGIISIARNLRRIMCGRYLLRSHDDCEFGFVVVTENGVWGLNKYFRSRGGEPGDGLLLNFDRRSQSVVAVIGSFMELRNECLGNNSE